MAGAQHRSTGLPNEDASTTELYPGAHLRNERQPYSTEAGRLPHHSEYHTLQSGNPDSSILESAMYDANPVIGLGLSRSVEGLGGNAEMPSESGIDPGSLTVPSRSGFSPGFQGPGLQFSEASTAANTPATGFQTYNPYTQRPFPTSSYDSFNGMEMQNIPPMGKSIDTGNNVHQVRGCPTNADVLKTRPDWFTWTVLILAVYSTTFSAILLGIAFARPRWGHKIGTQGTLSFSGATILSAWVSKTVELAFSTVFVVTLGQLLSRKAFVSNMNSKVGEGGISIAQINMRLWILQPGILLTSRIGAKHVLTTVLGVSTFIAAASAIFYTTAVEGLVSPKLRMGSFEQRPLYGKVSSSFANSIYLSQNCQTPIKTYMDPDAVGTTCLQIKHAGESFHNFNSWITNWARRTKNNEQFADGGRPVPLAILNDNTTVHGQWISPGGANITMDSARWQRLVQNVTMVMPHSNLVSAVRDPRNQIIQPEDLEGVGEFIVKAAVSSPAINVLCAGLSEVELAPMIVDNTTSSPPAYPFTTVLDDIFDWQEEGSAGSDNRPWFAKRPKTFNTVANVTATWGQSAIYLLAKSNITTKHNYVLCAMRSMQYPNCTNSYNVANSGGNLTVHCDSDPENMLPYIKFAPSAPFGQIEKNWKDLAVEWVRAVALTHGVNDGNASIARILTQMIPVYDDKTLPRLSDQLPSYGEALSVLAGSTLLLSTGSAPFGHEWTFSNTTYYLNESQYESFTSLVAYKDYASGGRQSYQGVLFVILASTFGLNFWCLLYLIWSFWQYGHVTDFTEPQNLFALALLSPPSSTLAGACGGGPRGSMLRKKWHINISRQQDQNPSWTNQNDTDGVSLITDNNHPHFYLRSTEEDCNAVTSEPYVTPQPDSGSWPGTPATKAHRYSLLSMISPKLGANAVKEALMSSKTKIQDTRDDVKFRRNVPKLKSMDDLRMASGPRTDQSPAVEQYLRLIGKR